MIRILATVLGLVALAVALVGSAARHMPVSGHPTLILSAAAPYLGAAAPAALLMLLAGRRWLLSLFAIALSALFVWTYLPAYLGPPSVPPSSTVDLRVLTANLFLGQADPVAFVALARDTADVVAVQELTQEASDGLTAAGMDAAFPHRVILPKGAASGIGIWSRHPITYSGTIDGYTLPIVASRIRIPGVAVDATVVSMHFLAPWPVEIDQWSQDIGAFPTTLRELGKSAGAGAVVVAGDFNATTDMKPFRRLLQEGYVDGAAEAGAGLARTYPGRGRWPPVIGIDHVLIKHAAAVSARTVTVPGADHRGLLATVAVPVDMTSS